MNFKTIYSNIGAKTNKSRADIKLETLGLSASQERRTIWTVWNGFGIFPPAEETHKLHLYEAENGQHSKKSQLPPTTPIFLMEGKDAVSFLLMQY